MRNDVMIKDGVVMVKDIYSANQPWRNIFNLSEEKKAALFEDWAEEEAKERMKRTIGAKHGIEADSQ